MTARPTILLFARGALLVAPLALGACGSTSAPLTDPGDDAGAPSKGGDDDATVALPDEDAGAHFHVDDSGPPPINLGDGGPIALPANFVKTQLGGYALGPALQGEGVDGGVPENSGSANCNLVTGVVRDFKNHEDDNNTGHPDFDAFSGVAPTTGLVLAALGADKKPVFAGKCMKGGPLDLSCILPQLTTKANFDQWYRYTPNVNKPFLVYLQFVPNQTVYTFQSDTYFPLDGAGWGNNAAGEDGKQHNFGFTTELHLKFTYKGGETFKFTGDDDVWVFINGKLAVDLGGLHSPANGSVSLNDLGLVKNKEYPLDLFQAERAPSGSTFRVDTNLAFTDCGSIPPDVPPPQ